MDITKRKVETKYGVFQFELVEYPGPAPLVDIYFNSQHLGYTHYINLQEASEIELLELSTHIEISAKDEDY